MAVDWRALLRNKWALGGLGIAGAAGAYVLYKRSKGGAGGAMAQESPGTRGGVGTFDSTGTDIAAILGQYQAGLQQQLEEFLRRLKDTTGDIAPKGGPTPVPTAPKPSGSGSSTSWWTWPSWPKSPAPTGPNLPGVPLGGSGGYTM